MPTDQKTQAEKDREESLRNYIFANLDVEGIKNLLEAKNPDNVKATFLQNLLSNKKKNYKTFEDFLRDKGKIDTDFSPEEIISRYARSEPSLLRTYQQSLSNPSIGISGLDDARAQYDELSNQEFINDPKSNNYLAHIEKTLLSPLARRTTRLFQNEILPGLASQMVQSGAYGSKIHGDLQVKAAQKLQEDYMDKAEEIKARQYQQAAQLFHAGQDSKRSDIESRANLAERQQNASYTQDQRREEMANKIQSERQNYLNSLLATHNENIDRPEAETINMMNLVTGTLPQYRGMQPPKTAPLYSGNLMGKAKGGSIKMQKKNLKQAAKELQKKGRHGDTMLAHINPIEASLLKSMGGSGTINPDTGLPEYFFPFLLPLLAGGLGTLGAGALGLGTLGTLGLSGLAGGIGGMFGPKDQRAGFLKGGLMGLAAPTAIGALGSGLSGLGLSQGATLSKLAGSANAFAPGSFLGSSPIAGGKAGLNAMGLGSKIPAAAAAAGMSGLDKALAFAPALVSGYSAYSNNQQAKAIQEMNKEQIEEQKRAVKAMLKQRDLEAAERRRLEEEERLLDEREREMLMNMDFSMNELPAGVSRYKKGGQIKKMGYFKGGYVNAKDSGIKDNILASVPEGSYVMDATTVSLLGDGNSLAGKERIEEMLEKARSKKPKSFDGSFFYSGVEPTKVKVGMPMDVRISGGEYVIMPEDVVLFSKNGDNDEGSRRLDKMRINLKKQKKLPTGSHILPKTKEITAYLG